MFLRRGIATRQFNRSYVLAEDIEVEGARLDSGLLHIELTRPKPEVRVLKIEINNPKTTGPSEQAFEIDRNKVQ